MEVVAWGLRSFLHFEVVEQRNPSFVSMFYHIPSSKTYHTLRMWRRTRLARTESKLNLDHRRRMQLIQTKSKSQSSKQKTTWKKPDCHRIPPLHCLKTKEGWQPPILWGAQNLSVIPKPAFLKLRLPLLLAYFLLSIATIPEMERLRSGRRRRSDDDYWG